MASYMLAQRLPLWDACTVVETYLGIQCSFGCIRRNYGDYSLMVRAAVCGAAYLGSIPSSHPVVFGVGRTHYPV